jgi:hypothetical protein
MWASTSDRAASATRRVSETVIPMETELELVLEKAVVPQLEPNKQLTMTSRAVHERTQR